MRGNHVPDHRPRVVPVGDLAAAGDAVGRAHADQAAPAGLPPAVATCGGTRAGGAGPDAVVTDHDQEDLQPRLPDPGTARPERPLRRRARGGAAYAAGAGADGVVA